MDKLFPSFLAYPVLSILSSLGLGFHFELDAFGISLALAAGVVTWFLFEFGLVCHRFGGSSELCGSFMKSGAFLLFIAAALATAGLFFTHSQPFNFSQEFAYAKAVTLTVLVVSICGFVFCVAVSSYKEKHY